MRNASRVTVRPFVAGLLAAASLMAAAAVLKWTALSAPLRLVVALLPVVVYIFFLLTHIEHVRDLDELERRIQLEALAIAFPTSFVGILTGWLLYLAGFLRDVELPEAVAYSLALMCLLYVFGCRIAARRYR